LSIDEAHILLERYRTAIAIHNTHDSILWQQSSIFLLAGVTIIGFALSLPAGTLILTRLYFSFGGIALASIWIFVNFRRQRFMETLIDIKSKAAYDLDRCLKDKGLKMKYLPTHFYPVLKNNGKHLKHIRLYSIDVQEEVHKKRLTPGIRGLVIWEMPVATLILYTVWAVSLINILLKLGIHAT